MSPSVTLQAGNCFAYNTTTANTGALTISVNSSGALPVQKWLGTALASGDMPANKTVNLCYDGANLQMMTIGNSPSGSGTTVTPVPPYIELGSTFYDIVMFAVTKPVACASQVFIGTAPTCTNGSNGNVVLSSTATNTVYWSKIALSSSIDVDLRVLCSFVAANTSTANGCGIGIWIFDSSNGLVWTIERTAPSATAGDTFYLNKYTCSTTCPATTQPVYSATNYALGGSWFGPNLHLRLSVSGSTLTYGISEDGGATYQTVNTQTGIGTIADGGIIIYSSNSGNAQAAANLLSVVAN